MIMLCQVVNVNGFSSLSLQSTPTLTSSIKSNEFSRARMSTTSMNMNMISDDNKQIQDIKKGVTSLTFAAMIALSTAGVTPGVAQAYEDYTEMNDIETVETVIKSLKESSGNAKASFKTFESISDIITEGKGVGGMISSSGVRLERGYVADEDTTIYNPGLSLLTETEKGRIVDAVIQNRKENLKKKTWSADNEVAFDFLKTRLDPLHMVELKGYLGILPIYGAAVYISSLAFQQFARPLFSSAYLLSAAAIFVPILFLIAKGV